MFHIKPANTNAVYIYQLGFFLVAFSKPVTVVWFLHKFYVS
jgi:hypothetical protein